MSESEVIEVNITDNVKIGGYMYDVIRPTESFGSNGILCDGEHDLANQMIKVASVGNEHYQETVFIHEICHGIIKYYCDESNIVDNEKFVEQFSKGLYQVITDNPEIFKK